MSKEYVAKILKHKRQEAGYSVKDISQKFNKSIKTIYSWENGQGQPDADTLISLCYLYGIQSFDELDESKKGSNPSSDEITQLILFYNKLNNIGKREAMKRLEELTYIDKYIVEQKNENQIKENERPYHFSAELVARNGENTKISGNMEITPEEFAEAMKKAAEESKNVDL